MHDAELIALVTKGEAGAALEALRANPGSAAARDARGVSVVCLAVYHGRAELAAALAAARSDLDVHEAACVGDVERVKALCTGDASLVDAVSPDGFSPAGYAAFFGHLALLRVLIGLGAAVDAPSQNEMRVRPLHSAAAQRDPGKSVELTRMLLDAGADPDARQQGGFTPLHEAAHSGKLELLRLLLERGADPTLTNEQGQSAADLARASGHAEAERLLATR